MAPVAPKKRSSIRAKVAKSGSGVHLPATHREGAFLEDGFLNTKKDKRTIKHSSFMNRIEKAHTKTPKRRRPSKKLITTLDSLVDALPDTDGAEVEVGDGRIRHKSVRTRPGALKRKEKLEKMERERFGKNMAALSTTVSAPVVPVLNSNTSAPGQASSTSGRWAALRGFITQTLEQKEEFAGKLNSL